MTKENYKDVLLNWLDGYEKALNDAIDRYKKAKTLSDKSESLKHINKCSRHINETLEMLKKLEEG